MADRPERPARGRKGRRKVCSFCVDKIDTIDYKDVARLRRFVSERAKILPRRVTGTCARHQRELTVAIKRARQIALMPFVPLAAFSTAGGTFHVLFPDHPEIARRGLRNQIF